MSARTPSSPTPQTPPGATRSSAIGWSASFAGLRPLTALTACAALSAFVDPAMAQTQPPAQAHDQALLEVEAPMPPPHLEIANGNRRDGG